MENEAKPPAEMQGSQGTLAKRTVGWGPWALKGGALVTSLLFIIYHFWLRWVFVAVGGLSLVAASRSYSSLQCLASPCGGCSCCRARGSRLADFSSCGYRLSCSVACGILPDQGSNPCPLNWQADSYPLDHQGNPLFFNINFFPWLSRCWLWHAGSLVVTCELLVAAHGI